MKTWDPLSLFKYLTGSPNIHVTFAILLSVHISKMMNEPPRIRPLCLAEGDGETAWERSERIFEDKQAVVIQMIVSHSACFFLQLFIESGLL